MNRKRRHPQLIALAALSALLATSLACGVASARSVAYRIPHLPHGVRVELLDEYGRALPTAVRNGRRYVLGEHGRRYVIRVVNPSGRRVEVVAAVDGLDVVDGKVASFAKRGYIVNPGGEVRIEGWRTSYSTVAAFRFGSVSNSYAGRTSGARNVGVIGVAIFAERERPQVLLPVRPRPRPRWRVGSIFGRGEAAKAPAADAPATPADRGPAGAAAGAAPRASKAKSAPARGRGGYGEGAGAVARRRERGLADVERERPGLGTEFGERLGSSVRLVSFEREHPTRPTGYAELRYNDRAGLARLGIHFGPAYADDTHLRETATPFPGNFARPPY